MSISSFPEITKGYLQEVARGEISGQSLFRMFGRNIDVDTSLIDIGMEDTTFVWPTVAATLEAISSSAADDIAGVGARVITVTGLDANFVEKTEDINMNGTSVTTATTKLFVRVNRVEVKESGTYADTNLGSNTGDITLRVSGGGATLGFISNNPSGVGFNQDFKFTIPTGFNGVVIGASVNLDANKIAKLFIYVRSGADVVVAPFSSKRIVGSTIQEIARDLPNENLNIPAPEKTDIWGAAIGDSVNTELEVTLTILLIEND